MSNNTALGAALTIDDSVLAKIQEAESKIIRLEQTTRTSADKIAKSFRSAGDMGIQYFIEKLKLAQTELGKINMPKIDFGQNINFGQVSQQATALANSVTSVSVAINQLDQRTYSTADNLAKLTKRQKELREELTKEEGLSLKGGVQQAKVNELESVTRAIKEQMKGRIQLSEEATKKEQQNDLVAYNAWMAQKEAELKRHLQVEDEKYKRTKAVIDEQLKMFAELEKKKAEWEKQNTSAKDSGDRVNSDIKERERMYRQMFDKIEAMQKKQASEAQKAAEKEAKAKEVAAQRAIKAAQKAYEEQAKLYQQQNLKQNTTYKGALSFAEKANTINRRTKAIQYLTQARAQLSTTDANYAQKLKALNDAIKRMNAENERAVQGARNLAQQHSNLMNTSDQLARKLALIFSVSQIQGYVNKLIQVRGEFELQNTALASILQNKDQADKLFGQIIELAIRSPFTVKELTTYTKSLAAYQVQYEDLYDTTKMLADVASGLGVDMQRLILAFGQVKAANFLRGTETRQFTEAGINMLGELAKYYTELEGRIVSVAEVQERQFKRMISFADVEQVFKRLTSAGGLFYQMQEKQAETLKGMVSNLQDSIDIMFNSIGEANDGTLKNMVSLVKSIVDNWEIFANIINASAVGFAAYTLKTISASVATKAFSVANLEATATAKGLNAVLAKSILMLKNLAIWLKANPFTIWATGLAFAVYTIADHSKKVQKAREEYDILSRSLQSSKNEIDGLKSRLDAANTSVAQNQNIVSKLKQGTEEYKDAQEKLTKAQSEQQIVLDELKSKYPEIYNGLVKQKDGTIDITEAQKAYNDELERTMTLNVLMRQGEGFFSDGIFQDFQDLSTSQKEYENQTRNLEASYNAAKIMIETLAKTSDKFYKQSYADAKKVIDSTDDLATKMQKLNRVAKMSDVWGTDIGSLRKVLRDATEGYSDAFRDFSSDSEKAKEQVGLLIDNILALANVSTDDAFKGLEDSAKQSAQRTAEEFIKSIPTIKDKFIQEFVNEQLQVRLGFTIDFSDEVTKELSAWQKRINEYIKDNDLDLKLKININDNISVYFDNLRDKLKDTQEEIEKLNKATEQRGETSATNQQQIADLQAQERQIKQILSAFGELETKKKKTKDTTSQIFKQRLEFFERANKEYEKLLKNYSEEEAKAKILASMMDEANQRSVGSIFMSAEFDEQGTLDSLNKVKEMYSQLSNEMSIEFAKVFGGIELDMDVEIRQDRIKTIQDQFSDLFGNYELSLELDKLGLDKGLASDLFGVEIFDLTELRKRAEVYKDELQNILGKEGVSAWDAINKKITEAEKKELEARLKQYAEYLKKSISAKAQAEIESQKEIAKIQKTEGLSYDTKASLIKQQREETVKIKAKLEWEDFKSSDTYIKMFDDLEYVSDAALKRLKQNLDMIKKSMGELEPDQLKAIQDAYNKIEEQVISRNPFAAMRDAMKEINELQSQGLSEDVLQQNLLMYDAQAQSLKTQISDIETIIGLKQNGISLDTQEQSFLDRNIQYLDQNIESLRQMVTLKKSALSGVETNIGITNKDLASYEKARMSLDAMSAQVETIRNLAQSAFGSIKSVLESVGVESDNTAMIFADMGMSMVDLIAQAVMFGLQLKILTVAATAMGVAINTALGPIGWAVMAIQGIAMALTAIFRIGDKKKEKEIQKQLKQVKQLEKAYKKLEKAIDEAYSIDTLKSSKEQAIANLEAQNEALKKSIAAEQDKKKRDDGRIEEWEQTIQDNLERIQELHEEFLADLGGFGSEENVKSAAQEFADAWLDAYLEIGDGLDALNDKWDEYIKNVIAKQLMLKGTEKYLKPVMDMLDGMLEDATFTSSEAEALQDKIDAVMPQLNEFWKSLAGSFDLEGLKEGDTMSGLQRGISGITETQADALAAITESIRFFSSDSNMQLKNILSALTAPTPENPYLLELKAQTEQLKAMNSLWNSLVKNGTTGKAINVRII